MSILCSEGKIKKLHLKPFVEGWAKTIDGDEWWGVAIRICLTDTFAQLRLCGVLPPVSLVVAHSDKPLTTITR